MAVGKRLFHMRLRLDLNNWQHTNDFDNNMSKKLWTNLDNFWKSPRLNKNNHFPMPPVYIVLNIFWKLYLQAER